MIYECGHRGCDICGIRICDGATLQKVGTVEVCKPCVSMAVSLALKMAQQFGGTVIDLKKTCTVKR